MRVMPTSHMPPSAAQASAASGRRLPTRVPPWVGQRVRGARATWLALCAWVSCALLGSPAVAGDYEVGPGDTLFVQVYDEAGLSGEVVVTDGCTITLALVGTVPACDRTTTALEREIAGRYRGDFLLNPTVAVRVTKFHAHRVDVLGEVAKPGPQYLDAGDASLVEVISMAGGPKEDNVVEVEVVSREGDRRAYDYLDLVAGQPATVSRGDKIYLKPGEVVYVEGEIERPGAITLSDGLTVTQAIALAGGADEYANLRRVVLRRVDGSKIRVNVLRVQRGKDEDVRLQRDDHLLVPRGVF